MDSLKEINDKKSPLFIITIAVVIVSIIARSQPFSKYCHLSPAIKTFELMLIIVGGTEIVLKTIFMEIFHKCCASSARKIHSCIIIFCLLANITLYGLAVFLYWQIKTDIFCMENQPHTYFLQVYVVAFTLVYLVVLLVMISVNCEGRTMTVLDQNEINNRDDSF